MDWDWEIYGCKRSKEGDNHMNTEDRDRGNKFKEKKTVCKGRNVADSK